jgi:hypothetical protein
MNRNEPHTASSRRSKRVVSLPCGHQVEVSPNATLLAVSGPVLDHQSTCRPERPPVFAAWFAGGPVPTKISHPLSGREPPSWNPIL